MGLGAVLHTLNPRLFATELEYIVNHAQDQYIFVDLTFVPLVAQLQDEFRCVKGFIVLTDREHMPRNSKLRNLLCYEDILQVRACILFLCRRQLADQQVLRHAVLQGASAAAWLASGRKYWPATDAAQKCSLSCLEPGCIELLCCSVKAAC